MKITRESLTITGEILISYTSLGAFVPPRVRPFVPFAERVRYSEEGRARHRVSRRSPLRWAHSILREMADSAIGAFLTPID